MARSPTARRWPAGDEVFAASLSEHPGWHRVRWGGGVLPVEGQRQCGGGGARSGGAQRWWRRSGDRRWGWWSPTARRGPREYKTHGEAAENPSRVGDAHQRGRSVTAAAGGGQEMMGSGGGARGLLTKEKGGWEEKKEQRR
jgi:hypothetical protein